MFTYDFVNSPQVSNVRLLVADTDYTAPIFQDEEIVAAMSIVQAQFQSGQFFSTPSGALGAGAQGVNLPSTPIPYYRVAAVLLYAIAGNKSRLASVIKLLDVSLDPAKAAKALQDQAAAWIKLDEESGAFAIIEQVNDQFSFRDRFWRQWQRQSQT